MTRPFSTKTLLLNNQELTATGNVLYINSNPIVFSGSVDNLSGFLTGNYATIANLSLTGSTLDNKINSHSGFATNEYATIINLGVTGTNVLNATNNNSINLSGNLQLTGSALDNKINTLSGYTNNNFSQVRITGSDVLLSPNFTGINGTVIFVSGQTVFISGSSSSSAGVLSLDSLVGAIQITGLGTIATIINGQTIQISGMSQTGAGEINTASNLGGGIGISFDKNIYDLRFNSISGGTGIQVSLNGSNTILIDSNINTGEFYATSNPQNYIRSGDVSSAYSTIVDLQSTGQNLYNLITGLSGQNNIDYATNGNLGLTGSNLYNIITGLSGQSNLTYATIANLGLTGQQSWLAANNNAINLSGNLILTGSTLDSKINVLSGYSNNNFYLKTNPDAYAQSGNFISGVSITGGLAIRGALNIAAGSNIILTQNGSNSFSIASSAGASVGGITGISVTGGNSITGLVRYTGIGGLLVSQSGNTILFSGGGGGTTNITNNYAVNSGSGLFIYRSGIASGVDQQFFAFPTILDSKPIVIATVHNDNFSDVVFCQISGANPTGFWANFSATLENTGFYLDIFASNSSSTGMATIVMNNTIVNTINQGVTGISVTGGASITGFVSFTGLGGLQIYQVNNTIHISGGVGGGGSGETNTASNLGNGSGLFSQKVGSDLQFKSIKVGSNDLYITGSTTELSISFTGLYITPSQTGQFYPVSNPQQYSTSGNLQSTGSILDNKINSLSGYSNSIFSTISTTNLISGNLSLTGQNLYNIITGLSGQNVIDYATKVNLTITGSTLNTKIDNLSGYSDTTFATVSNLQLTGQQSILIANSNAVNLSGNLELSGSILDTKINNLSGYTNNNFSQVKVTGSNILLSPNFTGINGVTVYTSGQIVFISGSSSSNNGVLSLDSLVGAIQITGLGTIATIINGQTIQISGISQTGVGEINTASNLGVGIGVFSNKNVFDLQFNSISGGTGILASLDGNTILINSTLNTGQFYPASNLQGYIRSGDVSSTYALISNLQLTGSNLYSLVTGMSGQSVIDYATKINLTTTGSTLDTKINNLSGFTTGTFATISNLATTGQQSWNAANNNAINLSGNLQSTGSNLDSKINNLSGYSNNTFATISTTNTISGNLIITGQTLYNQIVGLSGTVTGNYLLKSQTGQFYAASNLQGYATSGNLASSGSTLDNKINSLSGYLTGNFATINNLALTGQQAWSAANNNAINLSGNLQTTGSTLDLKINSLSGYSNNTFATIANLATTGTNLYNIITGLSGQSVIDYATKINLASTGQQAWTSANNNAINLSGNLQTTGSTLDGKINSLSGYSNLTFATIITTNAISGNLIVTGQTLYNLITGLSGQSVIDYATKINLGSTGSTLDNKINSLSGYSNNSFYLKTNPDGYAQSGRFISGISITGGLAIQGALNISAGSNIALTQNGNNSFSISSSAIGGGGGVTGISITGGNSITGLVSFTGLGGLQIYQVNNSIQISGGGGVTTNNYSINSGSGLFIYRSGVTSGISEQFFTFPTILDSRPIVIATLHNDYFSDILAYQISGANTSGFWGIFSDTVPYTGYYFDIMASNSSTTGMATIVIGGTSSITSSTWANLTWATGVIWPTTVNSVEDKAILIMTGNSTLNIANLYDGWAGTIKLIQSGNRGNLTLPPGTKAINGSSGYFQLTTGISGAIDLISFQYDGTHLLATAGFNFN